MLTEPEAIVHRQLDAYNRRDIDRFMAHWADDCQYYEFPDKLIANGAAEIRERHVQRFQEEHLFAALISRMAVGDTVIDREVVTRTFPEGAGEIDVVAIYEIRADKIAKAWFKSGPPRFESVELKLHAVRRRMDAVDSDLSGSKLERVNFSEVTVHNCNLSSASFNDVNMSGWTVTNVNWSDMTARQVNLAGLRLTDSHLAGIEISDANLSGAAITKCRLDGMTIDGIAVKDLLATYREHTTSTADGKSSTH